ncbi:MAG TPA: hypothetical protein QGF58_14065 [Myxococcota bacterium]|nr:hypothetical protein [Myxococcota bacterium]
MNGMGSVTFDSAWTGRVEGSYPIPFLGLRDLIRAKQEAGHHKDLADLEYLVDLVAEE